MSEQNTPAPADGQSATQVRLLQQEIERLRAKIANGPAASRLVSERLVESQQRAQAMADRNEKLVATLRDAKDQLAHLREEIDRLAAPPNGFAVYLRSHDESTVDILSAGRKMRVGISPEIAADRLQRGCEVILNEALNVVDVVGYDRAGEVVAVKEILTDVHDVPERALVATHTDEERVCYLADTLRDGTLRIGDSVLMESKSAYIYERIPKSDVEDLVLEEVPDISYDDIGGLQGQIELIKDAVEMPFLHADLYAEHLLRPPKGVLLYGPPGCGKTLIAKAVANSLAKQIHAARVAAGDEPDNGKLARSYFLNIKGPELLNKFVGETERHIRTIFGRAREKASEGTPVIVFFDEMESIFRTRGTGVSSDVETTIVPQLLAEIDGVESLENVIVIGASNREDMIDPAILRPGRLDVKIKIERPDAEAAADIFSKYLTPELPINSEDLAEHDGDRAATIEAMIQAVVERMYAETPDNEFLEVTYANGEKQTMYFKDFNSGAMIQNIVDRAKKLAIKDYLLTGARGLRVGHLMTGVIDEFTENEDLPNTTNPDDWARISGKKGERIVYIRTLISNKSKNPGQAIETMHGTGQYL
ncbi:proteasome ATPase [Blastococcus sp. Marseille-P5729]|uniref:proteasome ATPase n=1 Tax=Blastococcus sp. Marseille-P5729 TaxID=2086582 RepID=UPI000D105626|nr:proteasome ATPase [Blastococcus sp. Marseille-P5729]